jgi:serine/threonine protein phosphatase 1
MFSSRKPASAIVPRALPSIPPGERVYAIGDVHGCAEHLRDLLDRIAADHAARGVANRTVILLGDLMNRGPDSAGAIDLARRLVASGEGRLLKGNHEELFVKAARGDRHAARALVANGGTATLTSFGFTVEEIGHGSFSDLAGLMKARIPPEVVAFLDAGEDKIAIGDFLFVHAGIRPGVPIADQSAGDLRWIRREFLDSRADHGSIIVHGHTITETVVECDNRIGLDTGAYRSGVLTAMGLEGTERWFLSTAVRQ